MNIVFTNWETHINKNAHKWSLGLYFLLSFVFTSCNDHGKEIKPEIIPSFENTSQTIEAYGNDTITIKTNKFTGYEFYINNVLASAESIEQGSDFTAYKIIVPLKCGSGPVELVNDKRRIQGPQLNYLNQYASFWSNYGIGNALCSYKDDTFLTWDPFSGSFTNFTTLRVAGFSVNGFVYAQLQKTKFSTSTSPSGIVNIGIAPGMILNNSGSVYFGSYPTSKIYNVAVINGTGVSYYANGAYAGNFKNQIIGLCEDSKNNIYTIEYKRPYIQMLNQGGILQFVGSAVKGFSDGDGTQAKFTSIRSMVIDKNDNLFVADSNCVRMITPDAKVKTIIGSFEAGDAVGTPEETRFNVIKALAFDKDGLLYILDHGNGKIKVFDKSTNKIRVVKGIAIPMFNDFGGSGVDYPFNIPLHFDSNQNMLMFFPTKDTPALLGIREDNVPNSYFNSVFDKNAVRSIEFTQ